MRTGQDLVSHPLLPMLQSCHSADAVLSVLREQIPTFHESSIDGRLSNRFNSIVNVLCSFSAALGEGVGLVNTTVLSLGAFF